MLDAAASASYSSKLRSATGPIAGASAGAGARGTRLGTTSAAAGASGAVAASTRLIWKSSPAVPRAVRPGTAGGAVVSGGSDADTATSAPGVVTPADAVFGSKVCRT